MTDSEIVDDSVRRAADLREMAAAASSFASQLLLDLAKFYDERTVRVLKRLSAH